MDSDYSWPVLRRYDSEHLREIAMPLGGIGTGTVSLGGRGDLRDWEITGQPRKGYRKPTSFFLLRCETEAGDVAMRALESEVQPPFEHSRGFDEPGRHEQYGLPRFREGAFHVAYPLAQVLLSDPDVPLRVRLQAFNPMVPGDSERSGVPVAVLRYVLENPSDVAVKASVMGALTNDLGSELEGSGRFTNVNEGRKGSGLRGVLMGAPDVPVGNPARGTMALAACEDEGEVCQCLSWRGQRRPVAVERLWRSLAADGLPELEERDDARPSAALTVSTTVPARGQREVTFLLGWRFPNRRTWSSVDPADVKTDDDGHSGCCADPNNVGDWYATRYSDAWDVLETTAPRLDELEEKTVDFVRTFVKSDVPDAIKEAALFNTSTLRSTTCFRTRDGHFYGFEGSSPRSGCCHGSCTHVWGYESATPYLYGELSRSMRTTHFLDGTDGEGRMSFRLNLPREYGTGQGHAAADGQMAEIIKLYRDWKLCGDDEWLQRLWPAARRALEFAWMEHGWDGDRDGVMEGVQHNTSDLELFGPNPLMAGWYLTALKAAERMAARVGDEEFAGLCRNLAERGRQWIDENLFNGEYYVQDVRRPAKREDVPGGIWRVIDVPEDGEIPQQIRTGCQTDQLVGQLWAHLCGFGYILEPENVRSTLQSVYDRNFVEMRQNANFFRAFALNGERALVFGTYPENEVPEVPLFRFSENWTGCEYVAAAHMIYEGLIDSALEVIGAIRDRYDGRKRNPFNEPECGNHYVRAMASWSCYLAWTGFDYDAETATVTFRVPEDGSVKYFWSNGEAWGEVEIRMEGQAAVVLLRVLHGRLRVAKVELVGGRTVKMDGARMLEEGEELGVEVPGLPMHSEGAG